MSKGVFFILVTILGPFWALQGQAPVPTIWEQRAKERFTRLTSTIQMEISQSQPQDSGLKKKKLKKPKRILLFWRCETFIHTSIPSGNFALQELARKTRAFSVELADEYSVFNKKNLKGYDAILLNSTTSLKFENEKQRDAVLSFVRGGKGIIGIHGASDNFYEWEGGAALIGGQFNGHPWTANGTWAFKLDDPTHPLNAAFKGEGFWHSDEIYQYKPSNYQGEENLRVLVSLDMSKPEVREPLSLEKFEKFNSQYDPGPREVPVSWIREFGKGRLFYTNFGHREETYKNPVIMQHLYDGILYALGFTSADATPSGELPAIPVALAPEKPASK